MDPLTRAWLKVVVDGQAYLYAMHSAAASPLKAADITDEVYDGLMEEWKTESAKLVQELLDDESAGSVGDSTSS